MSDVTFVGGRGYKDSQIWPTATHESDISRNGMFNVNFQPGGEKHLLCILTCDLLYHTSQAIMESGPGTCNWASYKPGSPIVPRKVALDLGEKLNCPLPPGVTGRNQSLALLRCLRNNTAEKLIENIRNLTVLGLSLSLIE